MNTQLLSFILFSFLSDEKKKEEQDVHIWQVIDGLIKFNIK